MPNNRLIAKYHIVCNQLRMTKEDREALLSGYGVESSTELNNMQLLEIIEKLQKVSFGSAQDDGKGSVQSTQPVNNEGDKYRKQLMAVIAEYLRITGQTLSDRTENSNYIKGIAVQAAPGVQSFNKIPVSRLKFLISRFKYKCKNLTCVDDVLDEILNKSMINN